MESMNWHRYFGLILSDFFLGSPFDVELEKDLSFKKQLLDVVIVRRGEGAFHLQLPDGLEDLADHNLITFKSYQDTLDDWALKELTGHYVNYRKQVSKSMQELLPEDNFRLYAVSARFPQNLAGSTGWKPIRQGVYECQRGTDAIRVLVLRQLPTTENNAMLHLFSASEEQVRYGAEHYAVHSAATSTLLHRLFGQYRTEGVNMSYTLEDFERDTMEEILKMISPEKLERVIARASKEMILECLSKEGLPLEKIVERLSPSERERLIQLLQQKPSNS